jgi:ubiquinone/menaquinone biosynthesis C-methylase UbiE
MKNNYYKTRYKFSNDRVVVWKAICEYLQKYIGLNKNILDLGSGYCDFINNIQAKNKYAVDLNPESKKFCNTKVTFICSKSHMLNQLKEQSLDAVFSSNLFEHLTDKEIFETLSEIKRILKNNGQLILIQPNYKYCYKDYYDDYTHKKAFSHLSLRDMVESSGFSTVKMCPRFLPFTFKSIFPKSYLLTKLYLSLPIKPLAKQMLLIFRTKNVE